MNFWNGRVGCWILYCFLGSVVGKVVNIYNDVVLMLVETVVNLVCDILTLTIFRCNEFVDLVYLVVECCMGYSMYVERVEKSGC